MKKIIALLLGLALLMAGKTIAVDVSTPTWLLVDRGTGRILVGEQYDVQIFPASTTKILTALVLLEYADPLDYVTVGPEIAMVGWDSSIARLAEGDILTVTDLVMAMMLPSGNDAAYTAAVYAARRASGDSALEPGDALAQFAVLMNEIARSLGAVNSNFVTPCGYHHPEHYSTARDMATISLAALEVPLIRRAASTREYSTQIVSSKGPAQRSWQNTNLLLRPDSPYYYPEAIGLKSGRTAEAGFCLVSLASRQRQEALVLVFGGSREGRWQDSRLLLDYYFSHYQVESLGQKDVAAVTWGELPVGPKTNQMAVLSQEERESLRVEFIPDSALVGRKGPKRPLARGQVVGTLRWLVNQEVVAQEQALALSDLPRPFLLRPLGLALTALPLLLMLLVFSRVRRQKRTLSRRYTYYRTR